MAHSRRVVALLVAFVLAVVTVTPLHVNAPAPSLTSAARAFHADSGIPVPLERGSYSVADAPILWPLTSRDADVSSLYGARTPPAAGASGFHHGVDFAARAGTPIRVVAAGVVISAGWDDALGFDVRVAHVIDGDAVETIYGHMIELPPVEAGDSLDAGQVVGYVGSTGISTGNHLHFELHVSGVTLDPLPWLYEYAQ